MTRRIEDFIPWLIHHFVVFVAPFVPPRGQRTFFNAWLMPCIYVLAGIGCAIPYYEACGLGAATFVALLSIVVLLLARRRTLMREGRHSEWGITLHSHHEFGLLLRTFSWFAIVVSVGVAIQHLAG